MNQSLALTRTLQGFRDRKSLIEGTLLPEAVRDLRSASDSFMEICKKHPDSSPVSVGLRERSLATVKGCEHKVNDFMQEITGLTETLAIVDQFHDVWVLEKLKSTLGFSSTGETRDWESSFSTWKTFIGRL